MAAATSQMAVIAVSAESMTLSSGPCRIKEGLSTKRKGSTKSTPPRRTACRLVRVLLAPATPAAVIAASATGGVI